MIRTLILAAGLAAAGSANAAFTGGVMRLNTTATTNANAGLGAGAITVFDFIVSFSEADDVLISIGNSNVTAAADLFHVAQADLFGTPIPGTILNTTTSDVSDAFMGDPANFAGALPPALVGSQGDSVVAIGNNWGSNSTTTADPSFAWNSNGFEGGWFSTPIGGVPTGTSVAGPSGFEVFAGRFALIGDFTGARGNLGAGDSGAGFINSNLFSGALDINWVEFSGDALSVAAQVEVREPIPAPGAAALFGLAGFTASRRRRG